MSERLANLVVIGVSRAGTTSLFDYLGRHPEIGQSDLKELRYFTPIRYGQSLEPVESYAQHFRDCTGLYAMEATPGYFYGGRDLARMMLATCGSVRAIVSLREPGDRCWSWFQFVKSRLRIPKDLGFEDYLDICESLRGGGLDGTQENQAYWGLGGGCYSEWLDDWVEELGDDLRVVLFQDLADEPACVVSDLYAWLGLDPSPAEADMEAANKSQQYRNGAAQKVAVTVNRHGERFFRRHPLLKRGLRAGYYAVNKAPKDPTMTPAARERLDEFFGPYNKRLRDQLAPLGLSLPGSWS